MNNRFGFLSVSVLLAIFLATGCPTDVPTTGGTDDDDPVPTTPEFVDDFNPARYANLKTILDTLSGIQYDTVMPTPVADGTISRAIASGGYPALVGAKGQLNLVQELRGEDWTRKQVDYTKTMIAAIKTYLETHVVTQNTVIDDFTFEWEDLDFPASFSWTVYDTGATQYVTWVRVKRVENGFIETPTLYRIEAEEVSAGVYAYTVNWSRPTGNRGDYKGDDLDWDIYQIEYNDADEELLFYHRGLDLVGSMQDSLPAGDYYLSGYYYRRVSPQADDSASVYVEKMYHSSGVKPIVHLNVATGAIESDTIDPATVTRIAGWANDDVGTISSFLPLGLVDGVPHIAYRQETFDAAGNLLVARQVNGHSESGDLVWDMNDAFRIFDWEVDGWLVDGFVDPDATTGDSYYHSMYANLETVMAEKPAIFHAVYNSHVDHLGTWISTEETLPAFDSANPSASWELLFPDHSSANGSNSKNNFAWKAESGDWDTAERMYTGPWQNGDILYYPVEVNVDGTSTIRTFKALVTLGESEDLLSTPAYPISLWPADTLSLSMTGFDDDNVLLYQYTPSTYDTEGFRDGLDTLYLDYNASSSYDGNDLKIPSMGYTVLGRALATDEWVEEKPLPFVFGTGLPEYLTWSNSSNTLIGTASANAPDMATEPLGSSSHPYWKTPMADYGPILMTSTSGMWLLESDDGAQSDLFILDYRSMDFEHRRYDTSDAENPVFICAAKGGVDVWGVSDDYREMYVHWSEVVYKTTLEADWTDSLPGDYSSFLKSEGTPDGRSFRRLDGGDLEMVEASGVGSSWGDRAIISFARVEDAVDPFWLLIEENAAREAARVEVWTSMQIDTSGDEPVTTLYELAFRKGDGLYTLSLYDYSGAEAIHEHSVRGIMTQEEEAPAGAPEGAYHFSLSVVEVCEAPDSDAEPIWLDAEDEGFAQLCANIGLLPTPAGTAIPFRSIMLNDNHASTTFNYESDTALSMDFYLQATE